MKNLELLISRLTEAKEELNKARLPTVAPTIAPVSMDEAKAIGARKMPPPPPAEALAEAPAPAAPSSGSPLHDAVAAHAESAPAPVAAAPVAAPQIHDTVEGFAAGLKALPKEGAARGKFITNHMNNPQFLSALQAHPQGKQIHRSLMNHLNSAANAGFKAGQSKVVAKGEDDMEKASFKDIKDMRAHALHDGSRKALLNKPNVVAAHKQTLPSVEEQNARANTYADFTPPASTPAPAPMKPAAPVKPAPMKKNVNQSYSPSANSPLAMSEKESFSVAKNGQWNIEPVEKSGSLKDDRGQKPQSKGIAGVKSTKENIETYDDKANIERKSKNTGAEFEDLGPNKKEKPFTGGGRESTKSALNREFKPANIKKLSGPAKTLTPEEIARIKDSITPPGQAKKSEDEGC